MFFRYMEKRNKIILVTILAGTVVIVLGCIMAFHLVFHYTPEKTDFTVTITEKTAFTTSSVTVSSDNSIRYLNEPKFNSYGNKEKIDMTVNITETEVRQIFKYIVKKNKFFLIARKFDKLIRVTFEEYNSDGLMYMMVLPTDYYITVKYNRMEKTIGGYNALQYYKVRNIYRYIRAFAEKKFSIL